MNRLNLLSNHIALLEGYHKIGSLAQRQNNPGNLRYVGQAGAVRGSNGFAKFPNPNAGFAALQNQIKLDASRGLSLGQFIYKYAPPSQNNSAAYLGSVARTLNVAPTSRLSDVIK